MRSEIIPQTKIDILFKLIYNPILRHKDLKGKLIDPKLFDHHLKSLIRDGLIIKVENGYQITPSGIFYTEQFRWNDMEVVKQPRGHVLVALQCGDKFMVVKRVRESFIGY